jgi:hypothetical protein
MAPQIEEVPSLAKLPGDTFEAYDYPGGFYKAPDAGSEAILRREVDEVARTPIEVAGNTMGLGVGNLVKLKRPLSSASKAGASGSALFTDPTSGY